MISRIKSFLFANKNTGQILMKNFLWLSVGTLFSKIIRSFMVIYAARILGASNYGIFSYAISFAAIFSIFSDIGLKNILTRELVKHENKKEYLATSLVLKIFLLIFTIILIGFISPFFTNIKEVKPLMIIMAGLVGFDSFRDFFFSIFRSRNKMQTEAYINICTEVIITIIGFWVLSSKPSVLNFSLGYLISSGFGFLLTLFFVRKYLQNILPFFDRKLLLKIIKSSIPFAIMGFFGTFMTNIDSVIIGLFKSTRDLGLFSAAQRPISILYLIPGILYSTLLPTISKLVKDNNKEELNKIINTSVTISLMIALPITICGIIIGSPFINVFYGYNYIESVPTFKLLLITLLPIYPGVIFSSLLLAENKQHIFIKSSIIGSMLNIFLDILLIPIYGIAGSAIATIFVQFVINFIFFKEVSKKYNILKFKNLKNILLSSGLISILVYFMKILKLPLLYIIISSVIIYFMMLILLKEKTITNALNKI